VSSSATFNAIVGQQWAVSYLARAAAAGRLSQTLIFYGPPYVGKELTALALAGLWLCDQGTGCGTCASCRQVATYQHPDLHYVFPCPAPWYDEPEKIGEIVAQRALPANRLGEPLPDPNLTISIEAVRTMIRSAARSAFGGRARVFIVRAAERLREEAQNAFLKLLEEAPPHAHIVLLTTSMEQMLPTVRSRAYHVRFTALGRSDWITVFRSLTQVDLPTAELLFRLSGGSLARAAALKDEDHTVRRLPLVLFQTPDMPSGAWVSSVFEHLGSRVEREELDRLLDFALLWVRDILVWRLTGNERLMTNSDAVADIADVATHVVPEHLIQLTADIESLRQASRLNLDPRLICHRLERLMTRSRAGGGHR
jgi:DNA polymerase-3 subunit delta'